MGSVLSSHGLHSKGHKKIEKVADVGRLSASYVGTREWSRHHARGQRYSSESRSVLVPAERLTDRLLTRTSCPNAFSTLVLKAKTFGIVVPTRARPAQLRWGQEWLYMMALLLFRSIRGRTDEG